MPYKVTLDNYPITTLDRPVPPIPGTTRVLVLSLSEGLGKDIWYGYLELRTDQRRQSLADNDPFRVKLTEQDTEIDKFREAVNLFHLFSALDSRDNCQQVTRIEEVP